ncbi:MAG: outer membrane protein assembly factor BamD [Hyphomonadaceae bacterium]
MASRTRFITRAALLGLAALLAACAGTKKTELQYQEQPVEKLYNDASDQLDRRRWTEAAAGFDEVERQHPYSSWSRRSMLMSAYAKYMGNKYDEAKDAARQFISLHPGNEGAAYAYYLIAICDFEQILDVGRDQSATENALNSLLEVVRRFPESEYARDARLKIDMTYDQLAGKEMEVGRFYEEKDQHLAAINRFKTVVEDPNYQKTTHAPEALHRLVECYLSVGMLDEAQKSAAVLGYNYPGSEWYQRTYALMTAKGMPLAAKPEKKKG